MELPLKITFRDITSSPALEDHIREKAAKLERFHSRIHGIRVTLSAPDLQHHKRATYHVQLDLKVPGADIVVNKERREQHHDDLYAAIRDAFNTAERQLRQHADRERGSTKGSEDTLRATEDLEPEEPNENFEPEEATG